MDGIVVARDAGKQDDVGLGDGTRIDRAHPHAKILDIVAYRLVTNLADVVHMGGFRTSRLWAAPEVARFAARGTTPSGKAPVILRPLYEDNVSHVKLFAIASRICERARRPSWVLNHCAICSK